MIVADVIIRRYDQYYWMSNILKAKTDEQLIAEATARIKERKVAEAESNLISIVHQLEKHRDDQNLKQEVARTAMHFVGHVLPKGRKKTIPEV